MPTQAFSTSGPCTIPANSGRCCLTTRLLKRKPHRAPHNSTRPQRAGRGPHGAPQGRMRAPPGPGPTRQEEGCHKAEEGPTRPSMPRWHKAQNECASAHRSNFNQAANGGLIRHRRPSKKPTTPPRKRQPRKPTTNTHTKETPTKKTNNQHTHNQHGNQPHTTTQTRINVYFDT